AEGAFGALAAGDTVLLRRQPGRPLRVGLDDLRHFDGPDELSLTVEHLDAHGQSLRSTPYAAVILGAQRLDQQHGAHHDQADVYVDEKAAPFQALIDHAPQE